MLLEGQTKKAPFNTLKGTSSQLLKSNLVSELSRENGLALAFGVDKMKRGNVGMCGSNQQISTESMSSGWECNASKS